MELNKDTDEEFWLEQHSWGDFPFDKPTLHVMNKQHTTHVKKYETFMKNVMGFVKELCNIDMNKKIRYPLL